MGQTKRSGLKVAPTSVSKMKNSSTFTLWILPVILAFCLVACDSSADSTADHFMSLLVAGKHLEAQEMLSKDMRSMATLLGGISNQSLNPYYQSGQFKSFTLTRTEKTNNSVRYRVRAVTNTGEGHEDFLDLTQEDGKWKVSRF